MRGAPTINQTLNPAYNPACLVHIALRCVPTIQPIVSQPQQANLGTCMAKPSGSCLEAAQAYGPIILHPGFADASASFLECRGDELDDGIVAGKLCQLLRPFVSHYASRRTIHTLLLNKLWFVPTTFLTQR